FSQGVALCYELLPRWGVLVLPMCSGDPVVGLRRRNRLAVGYPPYDHQHVLAFLPNSLGFLIHRGGRDARVPVRAASRQLSALPTGTVWNINTFHAPLGDEGKPRPYNVTVFWFWAFEIPMCSGDPVVDLRRRNRLAVGCPPYDHHRFSRPISSVASYRR
ncbi:MAG: hypothetical protein LBQ66_15195, partial [Planctomycetaceae bacterium]|nr:hypothetical protein [Planctomycetaceae bacterium]